MQAASAQLLVEVLTGPDQGARLRFAVPGSHVIGRAGTPDLELRRLGDDSMPDCQLLVTVNDDGGLRLTCLGPRGSATLGGRAFDAATVPSGAMVSAGATTLRLTVVRDDVVIGQVPRARLSHFHIVEEIGQGAFSRVYEAIERSSGRHVALKRLRLADGPHKEKLISAFLREIQTTATLEHPGIARVLSAGRRGDDMFLVMEFVDGPDLDACVRMEGPMSSAFVRRIGRGILEALDHAHGRGIIHRDLKPSNVMLRGTCAAAEVVLVDFGLAVEAAGEAVWGLTLTGDFRGTPAFTAPECLVDARRHSVRGDLFSVGATLYFALTGKTCRAAPAEHDSSLERLSCAEVLPLETVCPTADPDLRAMINRALAIDPAQRWPSARAMRDALADDVPLWR